MVQYMRPSSDINAGWQKDPSGAAGRYACINEEVHDYNNAIYAMSNVYQECKLSTPADTPALGGGILKWYGYRDVTTGNLIAPSIRCGSTSIKIGSAVSVSNTGFTQYTLSLSVAEIAKITDWSDVRVRFNVIGYSSGQIRISQAFLEVLDKKSSIGLEMGCSF